VCVHALLGSRFVLHKVSQTGGHLLQLCLQTTDLFIQAPVLGVHVFHVLLLLVNVVHHPPRFLHSYLGFGCGVLFRGLDPPPVTRVYRPKVGHPQIGQVLKVKGYCGDRRAVTPIAWGPATEQVLKATGLSGSGECPIYGLSTVLERAVQCIRAMIRRQFVIVNLE
jgi:hypothetical protein